MLHARLICCVVVLLSGCRTLKEADAAMGAWTREHLGPEQAGDAAAAPNDEESKAASGKQAEKPPAENAAPGPSSTVTSNEEVSPKAEAGDSNQGQAAAPDAATIAAAEALFEGGHQAMVESDYDTACARFEESNRLDPAVGSLLNLAVCEEKRGHLATAWQLFKRVMHDLPAGDDRYPIAQRRASSLRARVPTLTLRLENGAPNQTRVRYFEAVLGHASFSVPLPLDPGQYTLHVSAPKREKRTYQVTLGEGEKKVLTVGPGDPQ
jgi:hypothetical protein